MVKKLEWHERVSQKIQTETVCGPGLSANPWVQVPIEAALRAKPAKNFRNRDSHCCVPTGTLRSLD